MSDTSGAGNTSPSGHGTRGGGGPLVIPPPPPIVTNQQLLVLDSNVLADIPEQSAALIKIVQLEFARDVSALAATAYDRIIEELRPDVK